MTPCIPAWNTPRVRASAWAAAATWVVALLGGLATDIGPWYLTLRQPAWKPPDLWFGPAWTLIYTRTAVAGVRVWEATPQPGLHRRWLAMLAMLALNAVLNLLWSRLFFTAKRPDWALAEAALLWLAVLQLFAYARWRLPRASLLPYLAWVAFAACINSAVVRLN